MLNDPKTYRKLDKDPTKTHQAKLIKLLKEFKKTGNLDEAKYTKLYPTSCCVPQLYGTPKIHKEGAPLRPICSSINSVHYETGKYLADILSTIVGKSCHHIKNTEDFVSKVKQLRIDSDEILVSYDVSSLFTCIPVDSAVQVVTDLLKQHRDWKAKTNLTSNQVVELLQLYLNSSYFVARGQYYQQCEGCTMGGSASPVIANLFMEHFETNTLENSTIKPKVWMRFVDDTFVIIRKADADNFFEFINTQNPHIKFTCEPEVEGHLAFLDTKISRKEDGTIDIAIYRKPTHTDQYLHFDSHHPISHKLSVIRTLTHRAEVAVTNPQEKEKEIHHIKSALNNCGYRQWAFDLAKSQNKTDHSPQAAASTDSTPVRRNKAFITIPFVEGLSQKLQRVFRNYGVTTTFKPHTTLRKLLVSPKDPVPVENRSGCIYQIPCSQCPKSYIGQTGRQLGQRLKEHKSVAPSRVPSAVSEHSSATTHKIDWDGVKVLDREDREFPRLVREAIHIRKLSPELNRDQGLELPTLYNALIRPKGQHRSTVRANSASTS